MPVKSFLVGPAGRDHGKRADRTFRLAPWIALATLVLASGGAFAQTYVRRLTLPLVLSRAGGDGSVWTTELVIANGGSLPVALHYRYDAVSGGGTGEADDRLNPFEQRFEPDAIAYLGRLGLSLSGEGCSGTLTVTMRGLSDPNLGNVSARVTTRSGPGRAGLAIPGFAAGATDPVWLPGLRHDGGTRSNLALFDLGNPGDAPLVLRIILFPAQPTAQPVSFEERLAPGEFRQLDGVLDRAAFAEGYAKIERISGASDLVAYATVIDRGTNDPALSLPQIPDTFVILPEAVDSPAWRTELTVTNLGESPATVEGRWMTAEGEVAFSFPTMAGEQRTIPDLGAFVRGQTGPLGTVLRGPVNIYPNLLFPTQLLVAARVVSRGESAGYGVNLDGFRRNRGSYGTVRIFGLVQDEERRSSLVLSNFDGFNDAKAVDLRVTTWDSDAGRKAAERTVTVEPKSEVSFSSFLWAEAPGVRHAWVEVTRNAGENTFLAFSVLNDGPSPGIGTGDGQILQGTGATSPGPPPPDHLVSRKGATVDVSFGFGSPRSDETWLLSAGTGRPQVEVAANEGPAKRRGSVLSGGYEVAILQLGSGPGDADGVYEGLTEQGLPVEVVVDRGDLVAYGFAWTADPLAGCPASGTVYEKPDPGGPMEPGWPFGRVWGGVGDTSSVQGTVKTDGTISGSVSALRCWVGRIPQFAGGSFTARKISP